MSNYNRNSGFGAGILAHVQSILPTFGRVFVVFDPDDTSSPGYQEMIRIMDYDPMGLVRFYTSLESAYAATTSNNNDVILLDGRSTHQVAAMLSVAKNRIHFMGMDGGDRLIQQGAKIALETASTDAAATITVSGTRCSFRNLKIMNSGTHANSVSAVIGNGDEGTLWKNCTFQKQSDLNVATVSNFEIRSDSATFLDCEFGGDTFLLATTRPNLWIKHSGGTRMKNCRFQNCTFVAANTSADNLHVDVDHTSAMAFYNIMDNCKFINSIVGSIAAIQATVAVASVSSLTEGTLHFVNPMSNAASFSTTSDQFTIYGPEKAVAATTGLAVTPA